MVSKIENWIELNWIVGLKIMTWKFNKEAGQYLEMFGAWYTKYEESPDEIDGQQQHLSNKYRP